MIRFGPSGNDERFYEEGFSGTENAPQWISKMGLTAYEYSFGRGVRLSPAKGALIAKNAALYDVAVSAHAPYFINLSVLDEKHLTGNERYFMESAAAARSMNAKRIVFHPGAAAKIDRREALKNAEIQLAGIIKKLDGEGYGDLTFCAETMGKQNQLGDLEEVIALCNIDERLLPAIDFGHLYARSLGACDGEEKLAEVLDALEKGVGKERTANMHIHFSHIEYTAMGEKKHLTLDDNSFGPAWEPLAKLLAERNYQPVVICESNGTMARDAAVMLKVYNGFIEKR